MAHVSVKLLDCVVQISVPRCFFFFYKFGFYTLWIKEDILVVPTPCKLRGANCRPDETTMDRTGVSMDKANGRLTVLGWQPCSSLQLRRCPRSSEYGVALEVPTFRCRPE